MSQIDEQVKRTSNQELKLISLLFQFGDKPYNDRWSVAIQIWTEVRWTKFSNPLLNKAIEAFMHAISWDELRNNPDEEIAEMARQYTPINPSPLWDINGKIPPINYQVLVASAIFRFNLAKISSIITDTRHDIKEKKEELKKLEERLADWQKHRSNLADRLNPNKE